MRDATVLVVGLGDLGVRIVNMLATNGAIDRLVCAGRDAERGIQHAGQAALLANLLHGPRLVTFERVDLTDREGTARLLQALDCDVTVMAASRYTWWRSQAADNPLRAAELARLPYGVWLPVHVSLVRALMEARREAGVQGTVVSLPFPDGVGPALQPLGLAPQIGAGNVAEDAAKLADLAARGAGVRREEVDVRLVMHHAAERVAFPIFSDLSGGLEMQGEPPWYAEVQVRGVPLPSEEVDRLFRAPYPRPQGVAAQMLTAGAVAHLVSALLSERLVATHAPSPNGLPGGFPVLVSRRGIQLRRCDNLSLAEGLKINQTAARWDGLAGFESDGTIVFTDAVANAIEAILGMRLARVAPGDLDAVADEMLRLAR